MLWKHWLKKRLSEQDKILYRFFGEAPVRGNRRGPVGEQNGCIVGGNRKCTGKVFDRMIKHLTKGKDIMLFILSSVGVELYALLPYIVGGYC